MSSSVSSAANLLMMGAVLSSLGSFSEEGHLNGFFRMGLTARKALLELIANSLDAMARRITFKAVEGSVRMVDDGTGMTIDQATATMCLRNQNHSGKRSRGVSGIGLKPSTAILSKKGHVFIFTRAPGGEFLCISIPWDVIYTRKHYTGMTTLHQMTEEQRATFLAERAPYGADHGTTIVLPSNDEMLEAIQDNFRPMTIAEVKSPHERISVVFGQERRTQFMLENMDSPSVSLPLYNYFGEDNSHYICGKSEHTISQYNHATNPDAEPRFILEEERRLEFVRDARGVSKTPKPLVTGLDEYELKGQFVVTAAMRNNAHIKFKGDLPGFKVGDDPDLPEAADKPSDYEREHLGQDNEDTYDFRVGNKIFRNNQYIGGFNTPDYAPNSARAKGDGMVTHCLTQVGVGYNPTSEQDNAQDRIIGSQENKNQLNGEDIPKQLRRLVKYIKEQKGKEILEHFKQSRTAKRATDAAAAPSPSPAPSLPAAPSPPVATSPPHTSSPPLPPRASSPPPAPSPPRASSPPAAAPPAAPSPPPIPLPPSPPAAPRPAVPEAVPPLVLDGLISGVFGDPLPPHPVNVSAYRRGVVQKRELEARIAEVIAALGDSVELTGPYVELFNMLGDILRTGHSHV